MLCAKLATKRNSFNNQTVKIHLLGEVQTYHLLVDDMGVKLRSINFGVAPIHLHIWEVNDMKWKIPHKHKTQKQNKPTD